MTVNQLCTDYKAAAANNASSAPIYLNCDIPLTGRYLMISSPTDPSGRLWLSLCEVEIQPQGEWHVGLC